MKTLVVTGASGFLGSALVGVARQAGLEVVALESTRHGGPDLRQRFDLTVNEPESTVLVHCAAVLGDFAEAAYDNIDMAYAVARWVRLSGVFGVHVSSVSAMSQTATMYGFGKLLSESAWRHILPSEQYGTVRMAGIWGWQKKPTLFWNKLLLTAVRGKPRLTIMRGQSRRNYISVQEAARCLIRAGTLRLTGTHIAAGHDAVSMESYVRHLSALPGNRLVVDWQDDGQHDDVIFQTGSDLLPALTSFHCNLTELWANRPDWI